MSDAFAVEGKHALVTGASSGLGRYFATFLAGRGARVTVAARRTEAIDKTVQKIRADKGHGQGVTMDVTLPRSIDAALTTAEQGFGPVEILVNNAGVTSTKPALEQEEADWDQIVDTNLKGVLAHQSSDRPANGRAQTGRVDHQHRLDPGIARGGRRCALRDLKGGGRANDKSACVGMGPSRHTRQRARTGLFRDRAERRILRH